mgnify:CR=1 FL=1
MALEIVHPTVATSAAHLAIVTRQFSRAANREEMIAIAEKHKPHMLEADIILMRELFKKHPHHNQGATA